MKKENQKIKKSKRTETRKKKRNKIRYTSLAPHICMRKPKSNHSRIMRAITSRAVTSHDQQAVTSHAQGTVPSHAQETVPSHAQEQSLRMLQ